jgi:hypothetical protein
MDLERQPVPAVADHQRAQPVQAKGRALRREQIRGQAEKGLVGVDFRKQVLPV